MLYHLPLARCRRIVAKRYRYPHLIHQALEFFLEQTGPDAIGTAAIGGDEQPRSRRIERSSLCLPPPPDTLHRKAGGIMIQPHIHEPLFLESIINAIRYG